MMMTRFRGPLSRLFFLTAVVSNAQTETKWINETLGDWTIPSNWNNGVPNAGKDARIDSGVALLNSLNAQARGLIIGDAGSGLLLSKAGSSPPATLAVSSALNVGLYRFNGKEGTLDISQGATLSTELATWIGIGGTGRVTVGGPGSILYSGDFHIGERFGVAAYGTGVLTITNGGRVVGSLNTVHEVGGDNHFSYVGDEEFCTGIVTVMGSGSLWAGAGNLYLGGHYINRGSPESENGGSGILRIQTGGRVEAAALRFFNNGELTVDNGSTLVAGLVLSGGQAPPPPGGTLGDMVVGNSTAGRMEIRTGGTAASNRGYIGMIPGGDGVVTVTGTGSRWDCTGSIWSGNSGVGSLEITDGAVVTSAGNGYLGFATNTSGYANVSGAASSLSFAANLYVGGNGAAAGGSGTLQIEKGGTVSAAAMTLYPGAYLQLGANPTLNASLTVRNGVVQAIADTTFANSFTVDAGGLNVYTSTHNATFSGQISGPGGLTKQFGGFTRPQPGTLTLTGASNYSGLTAVSAGTLVVDGSITSDVTVNSGGTLAGNGVVGSVTVNPGGVVAPGNSPGLLHVNGNYTQTNGATLRIQIGGNTPGVGGYDQLVIAGDASLGGTLDITFVNGFRPTAGATFSILKSTSETGNFSTINSPGITAIASAGASGITLKVMTVTPVLFTSLALLANGHALLQGIGVPNSAHTVYVSADLSPNGFTPLPATATADGTGALQFDDAGAAGLQRRFYRLSFP